MCIKKINPTIQDNIACSEIEFLNLFSKHYKTGDEKIIRYYDDDLKDMYDHNLTMLEKPITEDIFNYLLGIKKEREENFIQICTEEKSDFLLEKGFEEDELLTLVKEDYDSFNIPHIDFVTYRTYRQNPNVINDVIRIEKEYYGKEYGEDFCERRWLRHKYKMDEGDNGLDLWVVYHRDQAIGYCYSFYNHNTVCVDGLLVINEYRHRYVASNLLKEVADHYQCPIFLHASEDETPKEMYYKLGFKKCFTSYCYLKLDKKYYCAYDDRYKAIHEKGYSWSSDTPTPIVKTIIDKYSLQNKSILDLGCGEGRDSSYLMNLGYNVTAVDVSEEAIDYCQKKYSQYKKQYSVLDFVEDEHSKSYDFIYSIAVLHMLVLDEDRNAFYQFIYNHLKDDGIALVTSMGDGARVFSSDVDKAFETVKRDHPFGEVEVAATSCRTVNFGTFKKEALDNHFVILEEGIAEALPEFDQLMYLVIRKAL